MRGATVLFNLPARQAATSRLPAADLRRPVTDAIKRLLDLCLALPAAVLCLPVCAAIGLLIRLETPGPVLFQQTRVGLGGRPFQMFKFRSMVAGAELQRADLEGANEMPGGILFKMRRDPRVTRLGHVLRRSSLDELPQLINVLRGEMSLVGPRPPVPQEVERYDRHQLGRLRVKPGLTCLWQISGRSSLPFSRQVELDLAYIERRSLGLDLWILLRTLPAVLGGRGAF